MVGVVRLELTRGYPHGILSAVRLPIPPHPHKRGYSDIGRTQKDRRYYTDLMFITSRAKTFKQLYL